MPRTPDLPPSRPNIPQKPGAVPPRPAAPPAGAPAAPPEAGRPPVPAADAADLAPGVAEVMPRGKRPLAAYTPEPGEDPAPKGAGPAGATFGTKGLRPPVAPGPQVLQASPDGGFEVRLNWGAGPAGLAPVGVDVRASAAGDAVAIDAAGQARVGGTPLAPPAEQPHPLPGGGTLTDWGDGYMVVESERGDSVSVFARGAHVDVLGRLA